MTRRIPLALACVAIALGVGLRFAHLDRKVFWLDEVSTAWTVSGYTAGDVDVALVDRHALRPADVLYFQNGGGNRPISATVQALARGDAVHAPLYYIALHGWRERFGTSVAATRALSACIGVLMLPAIYVLCVLLFDSALTGWVAMALLAVSPYFLYYAQDAREYSLLGLLFLLSSSALLYARRRRTAVAWSLYALGAGAGLYVSLLFFGALAAQAGYVLFVSRVARVPERRFWIASGLALLAFLPWLAIVARQKAQIALDLGWITTPPGMKAYVASLAGDFAGLFFYTGWSVRVWSLVGVVVVVCCALAIARVLRHTDSRSRAFIVLAGLVPAAILIGADLFAGGQRGITARYLIQMYLVVTMCVAYALASAISTAPSRRQAITWLAILAAVLVGGGSSCLLQSSRTAAWDSLRNAYAVPAAAFINAHPSTLLLVEDYKHNLLDLSVLSHSLDDDVIIDLFRQPRRATPRPGETVVVFHPSPEWMAAVAQQSPKLQLRPVVKDFPVFQLVAP